jgi:hypothetical protein
MTSTTIPIVAICVGIPVLCGTITRIAKLYFKQQEQQRVYAKDAEAEFLGDVQVELVELRKRVENLETILVDHENRR